MTNQRSTMNKLAKEKKESKHKLKPGVEGGAEREEPN